MNKEHIQRQAEPAEQMTQAIYNVIMTSCPKSGGLVAVNFPVIVQSLFNVVASIAAFDPNLSNKSDVREFADNARNFFIRSIRNQQSRPECARLAATALKAVVGPDGELAPAMPVNDGALQ